MPNFRGRRPTGTNNSKNNMKRGPGASMKPRPAGKKMVKKRAAVKKPLMKKKPLNPNAPTIERTGMESHYLKELVETETPVVVVCNDGETFRGFIRYYDRDV